MASEQVGPSQVDIERSFACAAHQMCAAFSEAAPLQLRQKRRRGTEAIIHQGAGTCNSGFTAVTLSSRRVVRARWSLCSMVYRAFSACTTQIPQTPATTFSAPGLRPPAAHQ